MESSEVFASVFQTTAEEGDGTGRAQGLICCISTTQEGVGRMDPPHFPPAVPIAYEHTRLVVEHFVWRIDNDFQPSFDDEMIVMSRVE